jgi:hypothetical protein
LKKSIKYAGIAAATLLAVAPVAAPVVSSTETTVKAATTDTNTAAMQDYADQFVDYTMSTNTTNPALTNADFGKNVAIATFDGAYSQFLKSSLTDNKLATLTAADAKVNVSAVTTDGTTVSTGTELNQYLTDNTTKGVKVTLTFNYNTTDDSAADAITKTFTITKAAVTSDLTSAALTYTNSKNVAYGTSTADYKLVDSDDSAVVDNNGDELIGNGLTKTVGKTFYTSYNDAYNAATAGTVDGDATPTTFNKENTKYYQVVKLSFAADSDFATLLTNHAKTPDEYALTVNGATPTGQYTDPTTFQTGTNADGTKYVTYLRSFTVGSEEAADWTTEDVDGVVTTKSDSAYYTLKNDDNDTITNRALAKNTAWKTNAVRTNSNGDKQYRVATGEWIDANDVTFSDGSSSSEGAYTDEQALNGKVTLDGPSSFIYMLYNDNGEAVSNRALAGDSAWYTDKKATNADGVTVYHVATGEWVQAGSGVNYVAY